MPVNGMSAGHFVRGMSTAEQIFLTDGAVAHVLARLAIVIIKQNRINAHAAVMAVFEVFAAANSTKPAIGTVVWVIIRRHPKIADAAVVRSEQYTT